MSRSEEPSVGTAVRVRLGSPFSFSNGAMSEQSSSVTWPLIHNETLKWLTLLFVLMQNPSRGSDSVALCVVHFLPTSWGPGHCQHLHLQRQTGVELHGLTATDRKDVYTSDDFATTEIGRNRWTKSVPKRRSEQYFRSRLFTLHEMLRGQIQSQTTDGRTHARTRARAHTHTH